MKDEYLATKMTELDNEIKLNRACSFLRMDMPIFCSNTIEDNLREICLNKLCNAIGLKCAYNYKGIIFDFFSSIMAEAVADKLDLQLSIAGPNLKYVRYNHVNLIKQVEDMLESDNMEKAFINVFDFLEEHKHLAYEI